MYGHPDIIGAMSIVGGQPRLVVGNEGGGYGVNPAAVAMKQAKILANLEPQKTRRLPLGFPATTVSASGTASVSTQPQVPFRPERLVIPSDYAGDLSITQLVVGKTNQLAASQPLPARAFTEFGWGMDMLLDTADVSQFVTLSLSNLSAAAIDFLGLFLGTAIE